LFFFFFSSRRRHTRLTCDWSSDVCSSDLKPWSVRNRDVGITNAQHALLNEDRKSTRLNSSHMSISYAVFCLKKKKQLHQVGLVWGASKGVQVVLHTGCRL